MHHLHHSYMTQLAFTSCYETHVGLIREENEDAVFVSHELGLYVVADGMGGHRGGRVASRTAIHSVLATIRDYRRNYPVHMYDPEARCVLQEAVDAANSAVLSRSLNDKSVQGMATTLVSILISGERAVLANVGDSRIYRMQNNHMDQLTTDHSWLRENMGSLQLSEEEIRTHMFRNIVTRAVGIDTSVEADVLEITMLPEDTFLLCSDGLTDMVKDTQIYAILKNHGDRIETAAHELVALANAQGGSDNITVSILKCMQCNETS